MPTYLIKSIDKGFAIRERTVRVKAESYDKALSKIWDEDEDFVTESEEFWFEECKESNDELLGEI